MVDSIFGKQEVVDSGRIRRPPPVAVKPIGAFSNGESKVNGYTNGHTNGYTNGTAKAFNKTAKETVTKKESQSG
jgi:hypothetical protein